MYIELINKRSEDNRAPIHVHAVNTFWYTALSNNEARKDKANDKDKGYDYSKVKNWTSKARSLNSCGRP